MIVVLDANVLVAALTAHGLCHELLKRTIRLRLLATSAPLLEELEATLHEKFTVTPAVKAFLREYSGISVVTHRTFVEFLDRGASPQGER